MLHNYVVVIIIFVSQYREEILFCKKMETIEREIKRWVGDLR